MLFGYTHVTRDGAEPEEFYSSGKVLYVDSFYGTYWAAVGKEMGEEQLQCKNTYSPKKDSKVESFPIKLGEHIVFQPFQNLINKEAPGLQQLYDYHNIYSLLYVSIPQFSEFYFLVRELLPIQDLFPALFELFLKICANNEIKKANPWSMLLCYSRYIVWFRPNLPIEGLF